MTFKNIYSTIEKKLAESTAAVAFYTPISATLETMVAQMSDEVSIKSRLASAAVTYCLAPFFLKGRELSKKYFGIDKKSSELKKIFHDGIYAVSCIATIRPAIYLASGETDWKKIALGTAAITASGAILGPISLYVIDVFKDLIGLEQSERTPKWLKKKTKKFKRNIAIGFVAGSIGLTSLIYGITPNKPDTQINHPQTYEQSINHTNKSPSYSLENTISLNP